MLTLDKARALLNSLSPNTAQYRAVMFKSYRAFSAAVCPMSDLQSDLFWRARSSQRIHRQIRSRMSKIDRSPIPEEATVG
jgi:hypothetical protein